MQVIAAFAAAGFTVALESIRDFIEEIRFRAKVAEVVITGLFSTLHGFLHGHTVVAVKAVAFDDRRIESLP